MRISTGIGFIFIFGALFCKAQENTQDSPHWDHAATPYLKTKIPDKYKEDAAVILNEKAFFNFTAYARKTLVKTVVMKIQTKAGLEQFKTISLPESFDIAENKELWQQGRLSQIKIPFIEDFTIVYFVARITKQNGKTIETKAETDLVKVRWIKLAGEFMDDYIHSYTFKELEPGDILEYSYKIEYSPRYGSDMLYLSGACPKLAVDYRFKYIALPNLKNYKFLLTSNIPDSIITYEKEVIDKSFTYITAGIQLSDIDRVNYFIHAMSARQLPSVYFNMNYSRRLYNNNWIPVADLPNWKWTNYQNTNNSNETWHTKFPDDIRKFVSTMPVFEKDSDNLKFVKALSDTLNAFRYYSSNYLMYNDPRLYALYSSDHLLKRRLTDYHMLKIYESILKEKKVFYYITNIQDKRLGENNPLIRNRVYENIIFALPSKNAYTYFVPRYNGLTYFLNELPFYYESAVAALFPGNYVWKKHDTIGNHFRFIKTQGANENENARTETAIIKLTAAAGTCAVNGNFALAGQFSTILRPAYLNELIDSSINAIYFKKCFNKPNAGNRRYSLVYGSDRYPFRHTFKYSEVIILKNNNEINLSNWFSFVFNKALIPEKPSHDYYFDFRFTDTYDFTFEFEEDVKVLNQSDFATNITNAYFELTSELKKAAGNTYNLAVSLKVKREMLPKEEAGKLVDLVNALEQINSLKIQLAKVN